MKYKIFALFAGCLLISCGEHEEKSQAQVRNEIKDTHYVLGVLTINSDLKDTDTVYFNDLQSVLVAHCVDEIAETQYLKTEPIDISFRCSSAKYEKSDATQNLAYLTCSQLLYSCVGHKFLELAELEGQTVIEGPGVQVSDKKVPFTEEPLAKHPPYRKML